MPKLPVVSGKELLKLIEGIGFFQTRQKGSHLRLHHKDGRVTTIPIHSSKEIPRNKANTIEKDNKKPFISWFL